MADPVQAPKEKYGGLAEATLGQANAKKTESYSAIAKNNAQKALAEVQTAQACVATAVQAENSGLKVKLPPVCDKYIQQKVESTITFPTSKAAKDQDGGGPKN